MSYKLGKNKFTRSQIERVPTDLGESIEEKLRKILANGEPIEDTASLAYTERKDGVLPQYDIRTDRQELALDAYDHYNASEIAKRQTIETENKEDAETTNVNESEKPQTNV